MFQHNTVFELILAVALGLSLGAISLLYNAKRQLERQVEFLERVVGFDPTSVAIVPSTEETIPRRSAK